MEVPEQFGGYRTPDQLLEELRESKSNLLTNGKEYARVRRERATAELKYERAKAEALVKLKNELEADGKKLPAEDMRKVIAHAAMDESLWAEFLRLQAEVDAYDRLIKVETTIISAVQSELAQLRTEFEHA